MKRLFVAIGLPPEVQKKLSDFQYKMKSFAADAKWVRVEGIHLTLKFMGNVQEERIAAIISALRAISEPAFSVRIGGCGFFPNLKRPNVFWAGVDSPGAIPLQQRIDLSMTEFGFQKEKRPFHPHLTLARFPNSQSPPALIREAEKRKEIMLCEFAAAHFSLYESMLKPQGAQYQILETVPLT